MRPGFRSLDPTRTRGFTDMERDERFWAKVDATGGPSACWPWLGALTKGYGYLGRGNRSWYAHRFAWQQVIGPIPNGLLVCHRCDNPPCCNPVHLFLGTDADNVRDMIAKGRIATGSKHRSRTHPETIRRGEDHHSARLTVADVRAIRLRYRQGGIRQRDLGQAYGVTQTMIGRIVRGTAWRHV